MVWVNLQPNNGTMRSCIYKNIPYRYVVCCLVVLTHILPEHSVIKPQTFKNSESITSDHIFVTFMPHLVSAAMLKSWQSKVWNLKSQFELMDGPPPRPQSAAQRSDRLTALLIRNQTGVFILTRWWKTPVSAPELLVWPAGESRNRSRVQYRFTCGESWHRGQIGPNQGQAGRPGRTENGAGLTYWLLFWTFKHWVQPGEKVSHLLQLPLLFSKLNEQKSN